MQSKLADETVMDHGATNFASRSSTWSVLALVSDFILRVKMSFLPSFHPSLCPLTLCSILNRGVQLTLQSYHARVAETVQMPICLDSLDR
jgi:hypothetical protein